MKHPSYEIIKARGPHPLFPLGTAILRYWEHCENEHGATPEEFGTNVKAWHTRSYPECTTWPTYEEASRV